MLPLPASVTALTAVVVVVVDIAATIRAFSEALVNDLCGKPLGKGGRKIVGIVLDGRNEIL